MKKGRFKTKSRLGIISLVILLVVAFLTIGFSAFSTELGIGLAAVIRVQKDIRITDLVLINTTNGGVSNYSDFNVDNIAANIVLPNSNSTVTYNVIVSNVGNMEASISEITGLPANLTYSISNYTLGDMMCDDLDSTQCKLGSVSTVTITIGYATNGYDSSNTNMTIGMNFTFSYMVDAVARINDTFYNTLQEAINAVPTDNTQTTITLLKNTSEILTVAANKNIVLNIGNNTISNNDNNPVFEINGTLNISNGLITSNAATNGSINVNSTGILNISGGRVIATGGRQAIYNNKGTVNISGNVYLSSVTTERATVQNLVNGTMTITGGTIVSTGFYAVNNAGALTIGVKDGNVNSNSPVFQSVNDGIYSTTNFNYYDGTVKSITNTFSNVGRIADIETGYGIVYSTEIINNQTYKTAHLGISKAVRFDANQGSVSETVRYIEVGSEIGSLPIPTRSYYDFQGWWTAASGGVEIDEHTIINDDVYYYAHWEKIREVARIGNTLYDTLQAAINAVPTNNTPTTITVLKDVSDSITVATGKNIVFDLADVTISNNGNKPIIENNGTISISNGTFRSSANQSIINNTAGSLSISGGTFVETGDRQVIYITGGTVTISGNPYMTSQTSGKPSGSNMERGTVQNISGTLIITGGTIVGEKQQAVSNQGILTIGNKDGNINATSPVLIGLINGIKTTGTFNFYDGIIKGGTAAISGTISDQETDSQLVNGNETINNKNYYTTHLAIIP